MDNIVKLFDWRIEDNKAVYYKGRRAEHSFALLENTDKNGEDYTAVLSLNSAKASDNTRLAFKKFTEQLTGDQFDDILHKRCRACFNVFHHKALNSEHSACSKCQTKINGFKKILLIERDNSSVTGMFGGSGRIYSCPSEDDRFVLGQFSCSILRARVNANNIPVEKVFSDKTGVTSIEKNGDSIYTAIYNKEGHSPIPDGLIFLFYDIFLSKIAKQISNKTINI
jgi:hypothetical protein